jgi:hypothetical protein
MGPATKSLPLVRNTAVCYKKDYCWYYVESLQAPFARHVTLHEINKLERKPFYVNIADLFVVLRDRPHPVHIPSDAALLSNLPRRRPCKKKAGAAAGPGPGPDPLPADADALYNYRKDVANGVLWKRFIRDVAAAQPANVHAFLLDAPPRSHHDPKPNSSSFLIDKKGVPPASIVVTNPDATITARLAKMGCGAHAVLFNDFVLYERPSKPFNYIYLDACGAYETQLRDGVRRMIENHERWIADEALLALVVCKRGAAGVLDAIRHDVDAWAHKFGYGRVLMYPNDPANPLMHSITFHLKRLK